MHQRYETARAKIERLGNFLILKRSFIRERKYNILYNCRDINISISIYPMIQIPDSSVRKGIMQLKSSKASACCSSREACNVQCIFKTKF